MEKTKIEYILIACCTCKRPNMLSKSLESLKELILPQNAKIELLIIDNDKESSAKAVVEEFQKNFSLKVNYFIEENRGIAKARNKLLKEALNLGASHIALFDDDEIVDKNWLISHFDYYNQNPEAIIISGPTYNKFEKKYPKFIEKNNIFKSSTTKKTGLKRTICASGNVFFPTTIASKSNIYFDEKHVFMGGEDGDFFSRAAKAGFTIVWNNNAVNYEMIGDERANLKWIFNRSYYNGYSGMLLNLKKNASFLKKLLLLAKTTAILLIDCLLVPFSLPFGFTLFFNTVTITCKSKGKFDAIIKNAPLNYYESICGN